jgi:sporulation protein YlmC with PRC-barrel domain
MKKALFLGGAVAAMFGAAPLLAVADDAIPTNAPVQMAQSEDPAAQVDAGSLVGQEVHDANGDKVGDIDAVMVDQDGKVASVVLDVSGWLESEKLIALNWSDLQMGEDDRITTSMTKETAESAAAYTYKDENLRGQVMTESGERYAAGDAPADAATETTTAETTDTTTEPATTDDPAGIAAAPTGTDPAVTDPAATDPAATDPAATDPAATDTATAVVNADGSLNASKLIGLDVQSPEDEKVGDIGEVVLDKEGQVQGVVVDVGGFLGIATHPVLLEWKDVNLASEDGNDRAVVNLNREKLEQMPAYESSSR